MNLDMYMAKCKEAGQLGAADVEELGAVLSNKSVQRLMVYIYKQTCDFAGQLVSMDLSKPEGISKAATIQGKVQGMKYVLEMMLEAANKQETDNAYAEYDGTDANSNEYRN